MPFHIYLMCLFMCLTFIMLRHSVLPASNNETGMIFLSGGKYLYLKLEILCKLFFSYELKILHKPNLISIKYLTGQIDVRINKFCKVIRHSTYKERKSYNAEGISHRNVPAI